MIIPRTAARSLLRSLLTAALFPLIIGPAPLLAADWRRIADDLEIRKTDLNSGSFFSAQMLTIRSRLDKFRPAVLVAEDYGGPVADVRSLCRKANAALCVNANFFDPEGKPLGVILSRGIQRQKVHRGGNTLSGVFQLGRNSIEILHRNDFRPENALEALQAGPRILAAGQKIAVQDGSLSKRAGLCLTEKRELLIYIVTAIMGGVSIAQLQDELLKPELACTEALNLDGGGSAQMYISPGLPGAARNFSEVYIPGYDNVPVALAFFSK